MSNANQSSKIIRFIDPNYNTIFTIRDGEQVQICKADGSKREYTCHYIDECHVEIGGKWYHIREFARLMKFTGARVIPFPSVCEEAL